MGWSQLQDFAREEAEQRRTANATPPASCPHDGQPLTERDGVRHCPWGDYEWPRDGMRSGIEHT